MVAYGDSAEAKGRLVVAEALLGFPMDYLRMVWQEAEKGVFAALQ